MKIINKKAKDIVVICCVHGNEIFGLQIFKYFLKNKATFPDVKVILANEKAVKLKKRYIEEDLNRVFGVKTRPASYESKIATRMLKEIKNAKYIIDIHTTTSDINFIPIITKTNDDIFRLLKLCRSKNVARMIPPMGTNSLINQVYCGISLEFNKSYARSKRGFTKVVDIVKKLTFENFVQREKEFFVYDIDQKIPLNVSIKKLKNLKYNKSLNIYPFLVGEKSYKDFNGFSASRYKKILL